MLKFFKFLFWILPFFIQVIFPYPIYAEIALTVEESAVLKTFFRTLIEESETGYVLYDRKPVCIYGYQELNPFSVNSPRHKQSVAIKEAFDTTTPPFRQVDECISTEQQEYLPFKPSFGYRSVKEEMADLQKMVNISSEKLTNEKPFYIFGWVKATDVEKKNT